MSLLSSFSKANLRRIYLCLFFAIIIIGIFFVGIMVNGTGHAQSFMPGNRPAPPGMMSNQTSSAGMDSGEMRRSVQQKTAHCSNQQVRDELQLSESQQKQIDQYRFKYGKSLLPLENELAEKRAQLRSASTGDDVSLSKINKLIDEIGEIQTRIMKLHAALQQDIRKVLNEEQRQKLDLQFPPGLPMEPSPHPMPQQRG